MKSLNASLLVAAIAAVSTAATIQTTPEHYITRDPWFTLAVSVTFAMLMGIVCLFVLRVLEDYDQHNR